MKTTYKLFILSFAVLMISPFSNIAQEGTYKSLISKDSYVEMSLRIENGIAYYSLNGIGADPSVFPSVFDLSKGERTENGGSVPIEGTYYIIPFNGSSPRICAGDWILDCACYGNSGSGTCSVTWIGGGCLRCIVNSGCSHCEGEFIHGLVHIGGGGVLVRADRVVME